MSIETALPPAHRLLEVAISDYALDFPHERDPRVEAAAFPDMVSIYRSLVNGPFPPTQSEFADEVERRIRSTLPGLKLSAVRARASRTTNPATISRTIRRRRPPAWGTTTRRDESRDCGCRSRTIQADTKKPARGRLLVHA